MGYLTSALGILLSGCSAPKNVGTLRFICKSIEVDGKAQDLGDVDLAKATGIVRITRYKDIWDPANDAAGEVITVDCSADGHENTLEYAVGAIEFESEHKLTDTLELRYTWCLAVCNTGIQLASLTSEWEEHISVADMVEFCAWMRRMQEAGRLPADASITLCRNTCS